MQSKMFRSGVRSQSSSVSCLLGASLFIAACGGSTPTPGVDMGTMTPPPAVDLAPPAAPAIAWPGTWSVKASYSVACLFGGAGSPNRGTLNHTNTLVVSANGTGGLDGVVDSAAAGYRLSGTGTKNGLNLNGKYPVRDFQNNVIGSGSTDQNMITLTIDKITSHDEVSGSIAGSFKGRFGHDCTIDNGGTITMSR